MIKEYWLEEQWFIGSSFRYEDVQEIIDKNAGEYVKR